MPATFVKEDRGFESPCLIWQGSKRDGYGLMRDKDRKVKNAHRVFWMRRHGPIPEELQVDHLCRTRDCVNTDHLELVTTLENTRRGLRAKLSMPKARYIRVSRLSGVTLANLFGVSASTISDVRKGKTWSEAAA